MSPPDHPPLISSLQTLLQDLTTTPYPSIPNPPNLQKRASVALIIRLNPSYSHWPPPQSERPPDLASFFSQPWTAHAHPEILFIKRAARKGDRWTSHIALPGGKLDPTDPSDLHAAIRETSEEVGLDLTAHALPCGNLPQRIVTTHWGKKPLLVLCPYVFLCTTHQELPPLRLQPSEVASTHWVPLECLRDPAQRTVVLEDVSARIAQQETGAKKWMLGAILGKMVFAGIALEPSESLYSRLETETLQENRFAKPTLRDGVQGVLRRVWRADVFGQFAVPPRKEGPLLLWGLTLGVISDFLDLVPPRGEALKLWTYPSFTPLDVRFAIWLLTYRFKGRKRVELQSGAEFKDTPSFGGAAESVRVTGMDGSTECLVPEKGMGLDGSTEEKPDETGFHGLGTGLRKGRYKAAVTTMLEGWVECAARNVLPSCADRGRYYDLVRKAIVVALVGRVGMGVLVGVLVWRWVKRRGMV